MNTKLNTFILIITTMLTGLLAGFFYTWSFTIMQSLDIAGPVSASRAMVSINAHLQTGWFGAVFFGTPVAVLISLTLLLGSNRKGVMWLLVALFFSLCTLAITFTQHLPLNSQLANGLSWSEYYVAWTSWNHVRMLTSLFAFLCMLGLLSLKNNE